MPPPLSPRGVQRAGSARAGGSAAKRNTPQSSSVSRPGSNSSRGGGGGHFSLTGGASTRPEDTLSPIALSVSEAAAARAAAVSPPRFDVDSAPGMPGAPVTVPKGPRLPDSRPSTAESGAADIPQPRQTPSAGGLGTPKAAKPPSKARAGGGGSTRRTVSSAPTQLGASSSSTAAARAQQQNNQSLDAREASEADSVARALRSLLPPSQTSSGHTAGTASSPASPATSHVPVFTDKDDVMASHFRSTTLQLEIALRELIADSAEAPPTASRIRRVLQLFDSFLGAAPRSVADLLRMFRVEFCRAIFSPSVNEHGQTTSVNAVDSTTHMPYFEQHDSLMKERNLLAAEVEANERNTNTEQLQHEVAKLRSLGSYYEHEITRLTKDNDRLKEEMQRMATDAELAAQNNQKLFTSLDEQNHKLQKEARELQLQVFRLRKQARDQVASYNLYSSLRTTKLEQLEHLWEQASEKATLVLTLHQLESIVNSRLLPYEHTLVKSSAGEVSAARSKYLHDVQFILDEYHSVNMRRNAIEALDANRGVQPVDEHGHAWYKRERLEKDGYTVGLRTTDDSMDHTNDAALATLRQVVTSTTLSRTTSTQRTLRPGSTAVSRLGGTSTATSLRSVDVDRETARVFEKNDTRRWAEVMFGEALGAKMHVDPATAVQSWNQKRLTTRDGLQPLAEVGGDRFMSGVDLLISSSGGGEYEPLKSFAWVDPSLGVELPGKPTHVKVKFHNPMVREPARNFGAEDVHRVDSTAPLWNARWLPDGAVGSESAEKIAGGRSREEMEDEAKLAAIAAIAAAAESTSPSKKSPRGKGSGRGKGLLNTSPRANAAAAAATKQVADGPQSSGDDASDDEDVLDMLGDAHWQLYRDRFGQYRPFLGRTLGIELIDTLMLRAFNLHRKRQRESYDRASSIAQGRSSGTQMHRLVTERLFREEYDRMLLQRCFFDVLDSIYVHTEVVMKVAHEVLSSLESFAQDSNSMYPHCRVYLGCLAASVASPMGRLLAMCHTMLSQYWPLASVDRDVSVSEEELIAVLRGMYPSEGSVRVTLNELATEITIHSEGKPTLDAAKRFFTDALLHLTEPIIAKAHESVLAKTVLVHWSELDALHFWEAVRTVTSEEGSAWITVQHLASCCLYDRQGRLPPEELAHIAAEVIWTETGKHRPD